MNFNLYLDDETAKELDRTAKNLGETRGGSIREALRQWLDKTLGSPGWPSLILEWQVFSTCRRSNHIAANCCRRVTTPFREVPSRHQCAERLRARQTGPDGAAPSGSARLCDGTNWTLLKTRNMPIIDSKTLVTRRFCKYGRSASADEKHGMLG